MLSVIIPAINAEAHLPKLLMSLVEATVAGLVREVIVVDGGSVDRTVAIAEAMGATILHVPAGRGRQLAAGARVVRFPWMLFVHADTVLDADWHKDVDGFIRRAGSAEGDQAAVFRFALDDRTWAARAMEAIVRLRGVLFALPYGDQGLLISRRHYERVGGFGDMPLMEDVDMVRRIGRRGLAVLNTKALTSAERYRKGGYILRPLRNLLVLSLYFMRVPPDKLVKLYG